MSEEPESNPFASPSGDDEKPPEEVSTIPAPLAMAMLLGFLLMLFQIGEFVLVGTDGATGPYTLLGSAVLTMLITLGLIARSGPTWATARFYFLFQGVMSAGFAVMAFSLGKEPMAILSGLVQCGFCLVIFLALGRASVRKYHQLECPQCHEVNAGGDDLLCFQRRCRKCGFRW